MQIEMRIYYKDGHQDIMPNLNQPKFRTLENVRAEFNQDHIPYLQKYMQNSLLVIAALRIH